MAQGEHQTLSKIDKFIWSNTMPTVLLYGDSQLTHLKRWYQIPSVSRIPYRPTSLDTKPLDSCIWCAVPGTRFDTIHDKVCGIDIPANQDFLGDQWGAITGDNLINPAYRVCSLGGNDISEFDTAFKKKLHQQQIALRNAARGFGDTSMADFDAVEYWGKEKKTLHERIDIVYNRLGQTFPDAKIGHFAIMKRDVWCDAAIRMADNLDWYVHNKLGIKLLSINDLVNHTHLKRDGVHLNKGFRLFMDQVFSSLLNSFLQNEMVKQRRKRQEEDRRLKALAQERRRLYGHQPIHHRMQYRPYMQPRAYADQYQQYNQGYAYQAYSHQYHVSGYQWPPTY